MEKNEERDTIPRIAHIVRHFGDQLITWKEPRSFEQLRLQYRKTVEQLALEGKGRLTISRVGEQDEYAAPTIDLLEEAMRLGLVKKEQLPSSRKYLNEYRNKKYELTKSGLDLAIVAEKDPKTFITEMAVALLRSHPYFSQLLKSLNAHALVLPELSEGQLVEGKKNGLNTAYWAKWATEKINSGPAGVIADERVVRESLVLVVRKRFGNKTEGNPTNKAIVQAMNDAFMTVTLSCRNLRIDATTFRTLIVWGTQLLLLDQSRYVPQYAECNTVWLTAVFDEEKSVIKRKTYEGCGEDIAREIVSVYSNQSKELETSLQSPYLPIFKVRAEAAYNCKVTRALVDIVLEKMANQGLKHLGHRTYLHLGGGEPPVSEPVYRRGGNRRYQITIEKI